MSGNENWFNGWHQGLVQAEAIAREAQSIPGTTDGREVCLYIAESIAAKRKRDTGAGGSIPMLLWCPECGARHLDVGDFATKPHHTHACQSCGMVWRPAIGPTVGVAFLPGFKNEEPAR